MEKLYRARNDPMSTLLMTYMRHGIRILPFFTALLAATELLFLVSDHNSAAMIGSHRYNIGESIGIDSIDTV